MTSAHKLSKSSFIKGLQCLKSLYLYKHAYHLRDPLSAERRALFSRGINVGVVARELFPGGVDATPPRPGNTELWVQRTKELIESGEEVIYEAAFEYNGMMSAIDLLVKGESGWTAYEVKSSAKISATYILDASLQYYVIQKSGLVLKDMFIVNMNTSYVKKGKLDLHQLFQFTSVKQECIQNAAFVELNIQNQLKCISEPNEPTVEIGEHCFSPYPCDFIGNCWRKIEPNSVFELAGVSRNEQVKLFRNGVNTIADIPFEKAEELRIKLEVESFKRNKIYFNAPKLQHFLSKLTYPLYLLDFETIMPAIPVYDGTSPFQAIPFQFSLRVLNEKHESTLVDFVAEPGVDPRREFIDTLINSLGQQGTILVFDSTFEKGILKAMSKLFPELQTKINDLLNRIIDLKIPFEDKSYYHPKFKGSCSLKTIVPALAPDQNYSNLKISSGSIAMASYESLLLNGADLFKKQEVMEELKKYCGLDTLGMEIMLNELKKCAAINP